jgi:hypothetical protein
MNTHDFSRACVKRDFYVRVPASFLGQDFDSVVVIFVTGMAIVITVKFPVQDDGRSAGRRKLSRHLQFLGIDGAKGCGRTYRTRPFGAPKASE